MPSRKTNIVLLVLVGVIAAVLVGLHFARAQSNATTQPAEEPKPVATVKTALIRSGEISQSITAYGNVTAQPGEVAIVSVPIESRVAHLRVIAGQQVEKGALLIEIEPSPDARLQIVEARNALAAATKDLQQTQQRFDLKLATNQELQQSQQNEETAKVKLQSLTQRGAGEENKPLTADVAGLISKVDVQEGQIVPAGGPLIEVVPQDRIEVKLGVEPSDAASLKVGQIATLTSVNEVAAPPLEGKVRLVTQRVNPETRLVDVFVSLPSHQTLLLDAFVRAGLTNQSKEALIVPRQAVLPDDDGLTLFTVKDGHAVKHTVKIGLNDGNDVEIIGEGLSAGDAAVIEGNLELEDGMAVSTETSP